MATNLAPPSSQSQFVCDFPGCTSRYRRKEHLKRHQANHQGHVTVSCPHCGQKLSRKKVTSLPFRFSCFFFQTIILIPRRDLLRRHIRNYHPQSELPKSRSLKACRACRRRKESCDGCSPCLGCQRRGLSCSLVGQSPSRKQLQIPDESNPASSAGPSMDDYVEIYFHRFHPSWPFLHRSTFNPTTEPGVLVQSVMMVGMWVQGGRATKNGAIALHNRLGSAIQSQRMQWDYSSVDPDKTVGITWPIATYQSILLHIILSIFINRDSGGIDLGLRHLMPNDEYDLLTALVRSCRNLGMFSYPEMLTQHPNNTPITMIWVGVEEMKRFALALYKVANICTTVDRKESLNEKLLTIADLSFGLPDSDELWNMPKGIDSRPSLKPTAESNQTENGDLRNWINSCSTTLNDARVDFDWI